MTIIADILVGMRRGLSFPLWCVTSAFVVLGVWFGLESVQRAFEHPDASASDEHLNAGAFGPWDGVWYRRIAADGYSYDPSQMSTVAFYPLYPLAAGLVARGTGLSVDDSLLITSQLMLLGAFVLFGMYSQRRVGSLTEKEADYSLLALGLFPTTFWMRMSYSESTFLFVVLLAMLGMASMWRPVVIAVIIGLATCARPMGVALIPPFLWHLWTERRSAIQFIRSSVSLLPLCVWGIVAFMGYQWYAFDEPLAFLKTAAHWNERHLPSGWWHWIVAHATLEPLWQVYDPASTCCWSNDSPNGFPLFSMSFMNPVFVLFAWGGIGFGAWRKWICSKELLLCLGLFAIPYFTHAWRACGSSEARYTSVVFPFYIVLGQMLSRMPTVLSTMLLAVSAVLLAMYSALFVQWYWFY